MTELDLPTNGVPVTNGAHQDFKDNKKGKKQAKKAEKKRLALLERFPASEPDFAVEEPIESGRRLRGWLRPAWRNLSGHQAIIAGKSNALIAINAAMLSIAAHSIYRQEAGATWWGLIPLALTNVLSLVFAVLSARGPQNAALDELCGLPEDEYDLALNALTTDKEHVSGAVRRELRQQGRDSSRREKFLNTAYNVLLGGIPLSALMLGLCVALTSRHGP